jgi:hypothetical protein
MPQAAATTVHQGPSGRAGRKELAMVGNEQRPTDDVEGHVKRFHQDTEAVGEDQVADDTEGHGRYAQDTEAGDDRGLRQPDDTEGHAYKWNQDTEAVSEDQVADDTEGHRRAY